MMFPAVEKCFRFPRFQMSSSNPCQFVRPPIASRRLACLCTSANMAMAISFPLAQFNCWMCSDRIHLLKFQCTDDASQFAAYFGFQSHLFSHHYFHSFSLPIFLLTAILTIFASATSQSQTRTVPFSILSTPGLAWRFVLMSRPKEWNVCVNLCDSQIHS